MQITLRKIGITSIGDMGGQVAVRLKAAGFEIFTALQGRSKRTAALTYLIFCLPRFTEFKEDPTMHYHVRQGLGLLVCALALQGILSILVYWGAPHAAGAWTVRVILLYLVFYHRF